MKIEKLFLYLTIQSMFLCQLQILGPIVSLVDLETFKSPHDIGYFVLENIRGMAVDIFCLIY